MQIGWMPADDSPLNPKSRGRKRVVRLDANTAPSFFGTLNERKIDGYIQSTIITKANPGFIYRASHSLNAESFDSSSVRDHVLHAQETNTRRSGYQTHTSGQHHYQLQKRRPSRGLIGMIYNLKNLANVNAKNPLHGLCCAAALLLPCTVLFTFFERSLM